MITEMFIAFCLFGLFSTLITLKLFNTPLATVREIRTAQRIFSKRIGGATALFVITMIILTILGG